MPSPDLPPGFDFTDPDIYADRLPIEELAHMRKVAPIWWNEQPKGAGAFGDGGYWVLTKHKDVKEVSRRSDVFPATRRPPCRGTATMPIPSRWSGARSCC
jgi:cholest-4-en-3-one 26-monooxygenase